MAKKVVYNNESITMLKGPDKVRKRPGVILDRMVWMDVRILFLKSFQTPLMRHVLGMDPRLW